jgi:hypothetical protein
MRLPLVVYLSAADNSRWPKNLSDGEHFLLDIAERPGIPFSVISDAAELLYQNGLLFNNISSLLPSSFCSFRGFFW